MVLFYAGHGMGYLSQVRFLQPFILVILISTSQGTRESYHIIKPSAEKTCPPGYYGEGCSKKCPVTCVDSCDVKGNCIDCSQAGVKLPDCVRKCDKGYHGHNCKLPCSQLCRGSVCDPVSGDCIECNTPGLSLPLCTMTCLPGTYGVNCQNRCPLSCKDNCDPISGACLKCTYGKGPQCTVNCAHSTDREACRLYCPSKCLTWCNTTDGKCSVCAPGYKPPSCRHMCRKGFFGNNCSNKCSTRCKERRCDPVRGLCYGCSNGYVGRRCNGKCIDGLYGEECLLSCPETCAEKLCHFANGNCITCLAGYTGPLCDRLCEAGKHGDNCSHDCPFTCKGACDPVSGECGQCKPGYLGVICNKTCAAGNHGLGCADVCSTGCFNNQCNHVDGKCDACKANFEGPFCDRIASYSGPRSSLELAAFVVAGLLLPMVCLGFAMLFYKSRVDADMIKTVQFKDISREAGTTEKEIANYSGDITQKKMNDEESEIDRKPCTTGHRDVLVNGRKSAIRLSTHSSKTAKRRQQSLTNSLPGEVSKAVSKSILTNSKSYAIKVAEKNSLSRMKCPSDGGPIGTGFRPSKKSWAKSSYPKPSSKQITQVHSRTPSADDSKITSSQTPADEVVQEEPFSNPVSVYEPQVVDGIVQEDPSNHLSSFSQLTLKADTDSNTGILPVEVNAKSSGWFHEIVIDSSSKGASFHRFTSKSERQGQSRDKMTLHTTMSVTVQPSNPKTQMAQSTKMIMTRSLKDYHNTHLQAESTDSLYGLTSRELSQEVLSGKTKSENDDKSRHGQGIKYTASSSGTKVRKQETVTNVLSSPEDQKIPYWVEMDNLDSENIGQESTPTFKSSSKTSDPEKTLSALSANVPDSLEGTEQTASTSSFSLSSGKQTIRRDTRDSMEHYSTKFDHGSRKRYRSTRPAQTTFPKGRESQESLRSLNDTYDICSKQSQSFVQDSLCRGSGFTPPTSPKMLLDALNLSDTGSDKTNSDPLTVQTAKAKVRSLKPHRNSNLTADNNEYIRLQLDHGQVSDQSIICDTAGGICKSIQSRERHVCASIARSASLESPPKITEITSSSDRPSTFNIVSPEQDLTEYQHAMVSQNTFSDVFLSSDGVGKSYTNSETAIGWQMHRIGCVKEEEDREVEEPGLSAAGESAVASRTSKGGNPSPNVIRCATTRQPSPMYSNTSKPTPLPPARLQPLPTPPPGGRRNLRPVSKPSTTSTQSSEASTSGPK